MYKTERKKYTVECCKCGELIQRGSFRVDAVCYDCRMQANRERAKINNANKRRILLMDENGV